MVDCLEMEKGNPREWDTDKLSERPAPPEKGLSPASSRLMFAVNLTESRLTWEKGLWA